MTEPTVTLRGDVELTIDEAETVLDLMDELEEGSGKSLRDGDLVVADDGYDDDGVYLITPDANTRVTRSEVKDILDAGMDDIDRLAGDIESYYEDKGYWDTVDVRVGSHGHGPTLDIRLDGEERNPIIKHVFDMIQERGFRVTKFMVRPGAKTRLFLREQ